MKVPRKPRTPRMTAIHQVMFFGADSFMLISPYNYKAVI
jgi:hypothetical protein